MSDHIRPDRRSSNRDHQTPEPARARITEHHVICEQHGEACGHAEEIFQLAMRYEKEHPYYKAEDMKPPSPAQGTAAHCGCDIEFDGEVIETGAHIDRSACKYAELERALAETQKQLQQARAERGCWRDWKVIADSQAESIRQWNLLVNQRTAERDEARQQLTTARAEGEAAVLRLMHTVADILITNQPGAAWNAVHEEEKEIVAVLERMRAAERERCLDILGSILPPIRQSTADVMWTEIKRVAAAIRADQPSGAPGSEGKWSKDFDTCGQCGAWRSAHKAGLQDPKTAHDFVGRPAESGAETGK